MRYVEQSETFEEINKLVWKHLEDRDWLDLPPRAVAISLLLEAGELLEHYQWHDEPVGDVKARAAELADVIIYAFEYAQIEGIDIAGAVKDKLKKAAEKYPAEAFKGQDDAGQKAAWLKAKANYKKTGL
ncbi:MAG TPA: MazG-like family protein [Candidatus Saccharimonadales bacterium]|nr:MazG-like family protein [Candidatus Saccharimonadales bacterium]